MTLTLPNRAGIELLGPSFSGFRRRLIALLFALPPGLRERLLFRQSWFCFPLQRLLRRALGGAHAAHTRFVAGPMAGTVFSCSTAEKYFWMGSEFERDLQDLLARVIVPASVAYDIGGHCGYTALLLAALTGPRGQVFTFEPSPVNLERIRGNVARNAGAPIVVEGIGLSDRAGTAILSEHGSESCVVDAADGSSTQVAIRLARLDDFVYRDLHPAPAFMKVDVEGHAGHVLRGAARLLAERRPQILCELHNTGEESQVAACLGEAGYSARELDAGQPYPRRVLYSAS